MPAPCDTTVLGAAISATYTRKLPRVTTGRKKRTGRLPSIYSDSVPNCSAWKGGVLSWPLQVQMTQKVDTTCKPHSSCFFWAPELLLLLPPLVLPLTAGDAESGLAPARPMPTMASAATPPAAK